MSVFNTQANPATHLRGLAIAVVGISESGPRRLVGDIRLAFGRIVGHTEVEPLLRRSLPASRPVLSTGALGLVFAGLGQINRDIEKWTPTGPPSFEIDD